LGVFGGSGDGSQFFNRQDAKATRKPFIFLHLRKSAPSAAKKTKPQMAQIFAD
jgi:hypothetical protein